MWGEVVGIHDETLSMESLKCGKVEIITSQVECIDNTVIMESKGISYPTRVVECMQQSHRYHSEEVINGSKSWVYDGSHGRVDQSSVFKQLGKDEDDADKAVRNDDLDVQGEVAENQWVDMEKTGLMHDDSCNLSLPQLVVVNLGPFGLMRSLSGNGIARPTSNLEVVLSQAQYEGLCDGSELGLGRQNVENPSPLALLSLLNPEVEAQSNVLF
ncbi:hypothetical protein ACSBR1_028445 [Camellia fascicularis]